MRNRPLIRLSFAAFLVAALVPATRADATPSSEDRAYWGLVRDWQDLEGNRDGIWENEDLAANERGWFRGGVEKPSKSDVAAWRAWRDAERARLGAERIGSTGNEAIEGRALHALSRYDRRAEEFQDGYLTSPAVGDAPPRDIYYQRWESNGPAKVVTVVVPGYTESTSDWVHVANRMNEAGSRVYVFDPPGQGVSGGRRGDVEDSREWLSAYRTVLARAQAENPGAKVVVFGHSTGGGVALDDLHDRVNGQVHTRGPDGLAVSAPYLDLKPTAMNKISGLLSRIPFANRLRVPPLIKLSDDVLGARRLSQWQKAYGAKQTLHFVKKMSEMVSRHEAWLEDATGVTIPVGIVQGEGDAITNPDASRRFVEVTPGARFTTVDTGSHDLQHDAKGLEALLGEWSHVVNQTLGANAPRNADTRPVDKGNGTPGPSESAGGGQRR